MEELLTIESLHRINEAHDGRLAAEKVGAR